MWESDLPTSQGNLCNCGLSHRECELWLNCILSLLPISMCPFLYILSCRKSVLLVFRSFSKGVVLYVTVILICSKRKVISRFHCYAILNHIPQTVNFLWKVNIFCESMTFECDWEKQVNVSFYGRKGRKKQRTRGRNSMSCKRSQAFGGEK